MGVSEKMNASRFLNLGWRYLCQKTVIRICCLWIDGNDLSPIDFISGVRVLLKRDRILGIKDGYDSDMGVGCPINGHTAKLLKIAPSEAYRG